MADMISPLDNISIVGTYGRGDAQVVLSHRTCGSLAQINTWPASRKKTAASLKLVTGLNWRSGNNSLSNEACSILPIGPGRALVDASSPDIVCKLRNEMSPEIAAIVDLCHARVVVRICGKKAEWVLAKGIAVDFSIAAFAVNTVCVTSHHETGLTIRRIDDETFDIYVFTSLVRDFWHWLERAAAEVGYEVNV